jgi:hypothetical protein
MDEFDPITSVEHALGRRLASWTVALILLAFVCVLVAPVFGPSIKQMKRRQYVLYSDYEARARRDMMVIYPLLWIWAILGWIFFYNIQGHYFP